MNSILTVPFGACGNPGAGAAGASVNAGVCTSVGADGVANTGAVVDVVGAVVVVDVVEVDVGEVDVVVEDDGTVVDVVDVGGAVVEVVFDVVGATGAAGLTMRLTDFVAPV